MWPSPLFWSTHACLSPASTPGPYQWPPACASLPVYVSLSVSPCLSLSVSVCLSTSVCLLSTSVCLSVSPCLALSVPLSAWPALALPALVLGAPRLCLSHPVSALSLLTPLLRPCLPSSTCPRGSAVCPQPCFPKAPPRPRHVLLSFLSVCLSPTLTLREQDAACQGREDIGNGRQGLSRSSPGAQLAGGGAPGWAPSAPGLPAGVSPALSLRQEKLEATEQRQSRLAITQLISAMQTAIFRFSSKPTSGPELAA